MSNRYVTQHPLPTDHERELLVILMEECAEIQYHCAKAIRFGLADAAPGQNDTNRQRISDEVGDLLAVIDLLAKAMVVIKERVKESQANKIERLAKYMQTEPRP